MNIPQNPPKPRRKDLQGIRGVAIISVLAFHFLPQIFPNGYIGVDQFFVLSGYLMCMLLRKSSPTTSIFKFILNFYIRRLKRILPLYFLMILLAIIAILTIFPLTAIDTNIESGKKALVFMSNRMETESENYFEKLSLAIDIFTHTWSLSVEVQFYLLVPFLYIFGTEVFKPGFEIPYYVVLGSISYFYSIFFCSEVVAFNSVPARIWQFTVGMIAFLLSNPLEPSEIVNSNKIYQKIELLAEEEENTTLEPQNPKPISYSTHFLTVLLFFGSFFPLEIPQDLLRPIITVFTGVLMSENAENRILESNFLTYTGDISYSLYLIHWPIYAFWKLNNQEKDTWNAGLIIALEISVLLAILSFETYEKWYLKQSNKFVFIICIILFGLNLGVLNRNEIQHLIYPIPKFSSRLDGLVDGEIVSFEKAEELNKEWSVHDIGYLSVTTCEYEDLGNMWGLCRHKNITQKPNHLKVMLIGNSYAANHARSVYEECKDRASSIVQFSVSGCEPLYNNDTAYPGCAPYRKIFEEKVEYEVPDYLLIFSRFIHLGESNITSLDDDIVYQEMKNRAEKFSKLVRKKIFIMQQMPRLKIKMLADIVKTLKENKDLTEFDCLDAFLDRHFFQNSLIDVDPKYARLRYEKLSQECPKCELFDYSPYFFNESTGTWRFYDEKMHGLTYITQGLHMSFHGLELIRPVIRRVCGMVE
ncbi:unnamed protein product [Caenorhabditis brenneri]